MLTRASSPRPSRCTSGRCKVRRRRWGPEHTSTLATVNNLGSLYADQGKLAEAEQMYERALQGYEKALGARAHVDARHGQQPGDPL
jgi:hypothetical protein